MLFNVKEHQIWFELTLKQNESFEQQLGSLFATIYEHKLESFFNDPVSLHVEFFFNRQINRYDDITLSIKFWNHVKKRNLVVNFKMINCSQVELISTSLISLISFGKKNLLKNVVLFDVGNFHLNSFFRHVLDENYKEEDIEIDSEEIIENHNECECFKFENTSKTICLKHSVEKDVLEVQFDKESFQINHFSKNFICSFFEIIKLLFENKHFVQTIETCEYSHVYSLKF